MEKRDEVDICLVIVFGFFFLILTFCDILNRPLGFLKRLFSRANRSSSARSQDQGQLVVLDESVPGYASPRSGGLEHHVIDSLPLSEFVKKEGEHKPINADCVICLGEFEEGEKLKHLPNCTHGFHVSCIDAWFQSHSNCPLCRCHIHYVEDTNSECSVSSHALLETLTREDFSRESDAHFQSFRSEILQNLATGPRTI